MKHISKFIFGIFAVLASCSGSIDNLLIDKVEFVGPDVIKLQVGEQVELGVKAPKGLKASYTWVFAQKIIGEGETLVFSLDAPGNGVLTVIIKDEDKHLRSFERQVYVSKTSGYKVVGYLPASKSTFKDIKWGMLTHINLSFAKVNADGSLNDTQVRSRFAKFPAEAHANGVAVLVSVGGGGGSDEQAAISAAILDPTARTKMIDGIVQLVKDLNLDGADIDYEDFDWNKMNSNKRDAYEDLILRLREKLGKNALLTAALSGNALEYGNYTAAVFDAMDFITLMAYDKTGAYSQTPGPHSPFDYFTSLCETARKAGVPGDKIVGGVPFYGKQFPRGDVKACISKSYSQIVSDYPGAENKDSIDGEYLWYDGIPAITKKCQYIREKGFGGIMIWEITMDSTNESKSLLTTINRNL